MRESHSFINFVLFLSALITSLLIIFILFFLLSSGLQLFKFISLKEFFFNPVWNPTGYFKSDYGLLPNLWGSFIVTFLALIIAVPFGILSAIFLSEELKKISWLYNLVKGIIELFAAFPSVIIGLFGLVYLAPLIQRIFSLPSGLCVLNGGIILALMCLPTIISICEASISQVPLIYKEASYALGVSRFHTTLKVVLPAAKSGIIAGILLGFGRAIGETMAMLMVLGNSPIIAKSLFQPTRTLTTTIAIEMGETAKNTPHFFALFMLGVVLFVISFVVNLIGNYFAQKRIKVVI
ncbi:MAG: phosphate ABC transporter permease subunit PstC [candidate division WOR-3 bacterium]